MRSFHRLRRAVRSAILVFVAIGGLSGSVGAATCPQADEGKLTSCRSAVLDSSLPEFVDPGSAFSDCVTIATRWRSCSDRPADLDQAYGFLGAAFALGHDRKHPDPGRAAPYLNVGDAIALRLLEAAARSGQDARAPYPQLRFLLAHANDSY